MEMKIFVSLLIGAFTMYAVMKVFQLVKDLMDKTAQLEARLVKIEQSQQKRIPYRSQEEIINAMAALDAMMSEFKFGTNLIENARAHLAQSMAVGTKREEEK